MLLRHIPAAAPGSAAAILTATTSWFMSLKHTFQDDADRVCPVLAHCPLLICRSRLVGQTEGWWAERWCGITSTAPQFVVHPGVLLLLFPRPYRATMRLRTPVQLDSDRARELGSWKSAHQRCLSCRLRAAAFRQSHTHVMKSWHIASDIEGCPTSTWPSTLHGIRYASVLP